MSASSFKEMTKEREAEISKASVRDDCFNHMVPSDVRELLAEIDRLRIELAVARDINTERIATIDRLRHALYCIKVEYAYCTQCSASALAEQALKQKP